MTAPPWIAQCEEIVAKHFVSAADGDDEYDLARVIAIEAYRAGRADGMKEAMEICRSVGRRVLAKEPYKNNEPIGERMAAIAGHCGREIAAAIEKETGE